MLIRVRDEYRMILAHYQTLYDSSVAFGMRKALQANRDKEVMIKTVKRLEKENSQLEEEAEVLE